MRELLIKLYHHPILSRIFPTLVYCLRQELKDCDSVLDLGCGADSPLKYCHISRSVGVDAFKPYIEESKKKKIHHKYILGDITKLDFPLGSFDAVIMIEVLEHLTKKKGLQILKKAQKWAKKKIIVSSPNGYIEQREIDHNPYQKHLSGWNLKKMRQLGFKSRGLAGIKLLRRERVHSSRHADLASSIRFRPKIFWFVVAVLSQMITYYFPSLAFDLFSVKRLE